MVVGAKARVGVMVAGAGTEATVVMAGMVVITAGTGAVTVPQSARRLLRLRASVVRVPGL